MKVQTTRFGCIEVDETRLITFPEGMLGFPEQTEYALVQTNDEGNFFWLQSVERADLAFVVCDPLLFVPDFRVQIKLEDMEKIALTDMQQSQILIVVNKIDRMLTGNLQGPLVINVVNRCGLQLVLSERKYSTRHPLMELEARAASVSKTA